MTYFFLSIKPKLLVRTFSAGIMLMFIAYYLFSIPAILIPCVVVVGHVIYLCLRVGRVKLRKRDQAMTIATRNLNQSITLQTPVTAQRWWCYDFNLNEAESEEGTAQGGSNDLHVFLHLKDASGRKVVFTEYIGFDTRFPNECSHAYRKIRDDDVIFRVQRVDKLFNFLNAHLGERLSTVDVADSVL